jgi:CheY-like chemotaxis protein
MAAKLLDEKHGSGAANLNSHTGTKCAIAERTTEGLPSILSAAVGETLVGETTVGETTIIETTIIETTIIETLPTAAMPGAAFVEPAPWGGPETILLVEDEGFVRKVTADVLESAGYKLVIARSAAEALEAHRRLSTPIHLLLADVVMPGMSGCELAAEFQSLRPRIRVLLMSGYTVQLALCHLSPYAKTYLAKPFSVHVLLRKVREVLDATPRDWGELAEPTLVLR